MFVDLSFYSFVSHLIKYLTKVLKFFIHKKMVNFWQTNKYAYYIFGHILLKCKKVYIVTFTDA